MVAEKLNTEASDAIDNALKSLESEVGRTLKRMRILLQRHYSIPMDHDMPMISKAAAWTGAGLGVLSLAGAGWLLWLNYDLDQRNLDLVRRIDTVCTNLPQACVTSVNSNTAAPSKQDDTADSTTSAFGASTSEKQTPAANQEKVPERPDEAPPPKNPAPELLMTGDEKPVDAP